jgi:hypothetical protein
MTHTVQVSPPIINSTIVSSDADPALQALWDHPGPGPICFSMKLMVSNKRGCSINDPHVLHIDGTKPHLWSVKNMPEWIDRDVVALAFNAVMSLKPLSKIASLVESHYDRDFNLVFLPGGITWMFPDDMETAAHELRGWNPIDPNKWLLGLFFAGPKGSAHQRLDVIERLTRKYRKVWKVHQAFFNQEEQKRAKFLKVGLPQFELIPPTEIL